jgi:hypothetical protein
MLTRQFPFLDPTRIEPDLARRLRTLADDCERLALGRPVWPILLAKAPLLEDWVPTVTALGVQLVGHVAGHPLRGDRVIATSPVCLPTLSSSYSVSSPTSKEASCATTSRQFRSSMDALGARAAASAGNALCNARDQDSRLRIGCQKDLASSCSQRSTAASARYRIVSVWISECT